MLNLIDLENKKYTFGTLCMSSLLVLIYLRWLIEGILDKAIIEAVILLIMVVVLLVKRNFKILKAGVLWIPFILNIIFSLLTHESTVSMWGRGAIIILTICIVFIIDEPLGSYSKVYKVLVEIGLLCAVSVYIQYFFTELFTLYYVPLLRETAYISYDLYTRYGYYLGLMYSPHEATGLIVFTICGLYLWSMLSNKSKYLRYLAIAFSMVSLLMTGKKGVFLIAVISITLLMITLFISKKQWRKVLRTLVVVVVSLFIFIYVVIMYPEISFLERFGKFLTGILDGQNVDSGRLLLYQMAFTEWKSDMVFGIGWKQFNALSVDKYHLAQYHEVNCDYLQWLCETGIVGFLCNIYPVILMLYRAILLCKNYLVHLKKIEEKWVVLFSVFVNIFIVLYAFIEIPFQSIVFFTIYILSCIVLNSAYKEFKSKYA